MGIGLFLHSLLNPPEYAVRLQRVFVRAGLPLPVMADPSLAEGTVVVMVGHKPAVRMQ